MEHLLSARHVLSHHIRDLRVAPDSLEGKLHRAHWADEQMEAPSGPAFSLRLQCRKSLSDSDPGPTLHLLGGLGGGGALSPGRCVCLPPASCDWGRKGAAVLLGQGQPTGPVEAELEVNSDPGVCWEQWSSPFREVHSHGM